MLKVDNINRKICLIGDGAVGKTSLIRKFVLDQFDDSYLSTLGVKISKKRIKYRKDEDNIIDLKLLIWDLMGQKEFKKAQKLGFRDADGAFIVCDLTRKDTLYSIGMWQVELFSVTKKIPIVILANKADLKDDAQITSDDMQEVSDEMEAPYYFTSAKTGQNVEKAFQFLGYEIIKKYMK